MNRRSLLSAFCVGGSLAEIAGCLGTMETERSEETTTSKGTTRITTPEGKKTTTTEGSELTTTSERPPAMHRFDPERYVERYAVGRSGTETPEDNPYHELRIWNTMERELTVSFTITASVDAVALDEKLTLPGDAACKVLFYEPETTYEISVSVPESDLQKEWELEVDDSKDNKSRTNVGIFEETIEKTSMALM